MSGHLLPAWCDRKEALSLVDVSRTTRPLAAVFGCIAVQCSRTVLPCDQVRGIVTQAFVSNYLPSPTSRVNDGQPLAYNRSLQTERLGSCVGIHNLAA